MRFHSCQTNACLEYVPFPQKQNNFHSLTMAKTAQTSAHPVIFPKFSLESSMQILNQRLQFAGFHSSRKGRSSRWCAIWATKRCQTPGIGIVTSNLFNNLIIQTMFVIRGTNWGSDSHVSCHVLPNLLFAHWCGIGILWTWNDSYILDVSIFNVFLILKFLPGTRTNGWSACRNSWSRCATRVWIFPILCPSLAVCTCRYKSSTCLWTRKRMASTSNPGAVFVLTEKNSFFFSHGFVGNGKKQHEKT